MSHATHKTLCSERKTCSHFNTICESPAKDGDRVHHLLVSSEIIKNERFKHKKVAREFKKILFSVY